MAVAIFLLIIVIVSVLLSFFSPWQFTEIASNWGYIDFTVILTFWICGIVFVRDRPVHGLHDLEVPLPCGRPRRLRAGEPPKLEWWLTIVTTIGVVAMLAPGLIVWNDFVNPPDDVQEVEVLSKQWGWAFRFPGEDGKFGTVHVDNIDADNTLRHEHGGPQRRRRRTRPRQYAASARRPGLQGAVAL